MMRIRVRCWRVRQQENLVQDKLDPASLLEKIKNWGGDVAGIGDVSVGLPSDLIGLSTAISIALIHPEQQDEDQIYEYRYAEIEQKFEQLQKKIAKQLRVDGWRFLAIPTDTSKLRNRLISKIHPLFPHKTAATCAGLGWIGKSGLLISPYHGPRLSWATVLTNAPYWATGKPFTHGQCGSCNACVRACPAEAISGIEWSRGTNYETMTDIVSCAQQLENNRITVGELACGSCIKACRRGQKFVEKGACVTLAP